MGEHAAAQLLALQDRVLEAEFCRADERDQAFARQAALEDRLAAVERQLALQRESAMAALRPLEEGLRSASVTADARLIAIEGAGGTTELSVGGCQGRASSPDAGSAQAGWQRSAPARMDTLFLEMSYACRGSRDEIKKRVCRYLPEVIAAVGQGTPRPVLDVGCGRGEWLEVLREGGVTAAGVDASAACVALCVDLGLSVIRADAVATLAGTPDGTLGGVSALHVVEHMPFSEVVRLLDEAYRCIASGGILLVETPNPESLMVGGRTFFSDPTHRMPITPDVLALVARERGFTEIRVERLHPYPDEYQLNGDAGEAERVLNQLLYGPQDYCIVARRP